MTQPEPAASAVTGAAVRVAVVATTWFENSHADVLAGPLMAGWYEGESEVRPAEVVSLHLVQMGDHQGPNGPRPDIGRRFAAEHGVRLAGSVRDALLADGPDGPRLAMDVVALIAEHGDYERNDFGQKLYPRRALLDEVFDVFAEVGQSVPVFVDKHLAVERSDAHAMVDRARAMGVELMAGSSLPLCPRMPADQRWPEGVDMRRVLVLGHGPVEDYGFHLLEIACAEAERATDLGAVRTIQALQGEEAARLIAGDEAWRSLLESAAGCIDAGGWPMLLDDQVELFVVTFDGLEMMCVNSTGAREGWALAAEGPMARIAHRVEVGGAPGFEHFLLLAHEVVELGRTGHAAMPLARTMLVTEVLCEAMRTRGGAPASAPVEPLVVPAPAATGALRREQLGRPSRVAVTR